MIPLLSLLALALAFPRARVPDEFGEQLARLAAPRASERAAAERWLQAHLAFERYPQVAEAALAGDAEVRGRLVRVLGSESRHLALALQLCTEDDEALAELGREAVRAGVARADPRLGEAGLRSDAQGFEAFLRRVATGSPPRELRIDPRVSLERMVEELELAGELPVGLALDASAATKSFRRGEQLPASAWNELLWRVRSLGVELECHGLARGRGAEDPEGAFVRITTDPGPARTGVEVVSEWLIALAQPGDEPTRTRAARNLAASGFVPATAWMEHLVRARGDRAALEGLLYAAARGRVAAALGAAPVFDALLAEAEAKGGPRSARILCALAHVGCLDAEGTALAPRLLDGFASAPPRARWVRLFLIERNGCAAPEAEAAARALLAEPATPAPLRLQALHTLAAQPSPAAAPPAMAAAGELFRLPLDDHELERLGRALARFGLEPPFRDARVIPSDWSARERLGLLVAWLQRGEVEPIAAHVSAWLAAGPPAEASARADALADELWPRGVRGARERVGAALLRARELGPAAAVERVRLLLGLVPTGEVAAALARAGYAADGATLDLALLGALAGAPAPVAVEASARERLLATLKSALQASPSSDKVEALLAALERAVHGLYAAGRDELADSFCGSVRQALLRMPPSPLKSSLERPSWPSTPFVERRDVSRALARFEAPARL